MAGQRHRRVCSLRSSNAPARRRPTHGGGRAGYLAESLEPRRLLTAILSDQTVTGSISSPGEMDEYTFTANVGDAIVATLAEQTATGYDPAIELRAPNGTLVVSDFTNFNDEDGLGADIFSHGVTQTGTYTLRVSDSGSDETGDYTLTMARLPGAQSPNDGHGGAIASGQRREGTVGLGDLDVYTFTANLGEPVILTTVEPTATGFDPHTRVYGPNGALAAEDLTNFASDDGLGNDIFFTTAATGTYYVVVSDHTTQSGSADFDFEAGQYALRMVKLPGAQQQDDPDGGTIASGQRREGTIALGDLDVYTFTASAGEPVLLTTVEPAATGFDPYTLVYAPNGTLVIDDFTNFDGDDGLGNDLAFSAPSSGTYYVVVTDLSSQSGSADFDFEPGQYALRMVKLPGAQQQDDPDGGAITPGQRREGTISLGDLDVYTFAADAGDALLAVVGNATNTPGYDARALLYGPGGALLDSSPSGGDTYVVSATAASSGTHYLVVADLTSQSGSSDFDFEAGEYAMTVAVAPGAQPTDADSGPITSGAVRAGSVSRGDVDLYTFPVTAGVGFTLRLSDTATSGFDPALRVVNQAGAVVFNGSDANTLVATVNNPPASGTYTAFVFDAGGDESGAYSVALDTATGADNFAPTVLGAEYRRDDPDVNVRVRFSEDVGASFSFTDVQILNLDTGLLLPDFGLSTSYDAGGDLFSVSFPGFDRRVPPDGNYRLMVTGTDLEDAAGNPLAANINFDFTAIAGLTASPDAAFTLTYPSGPAGPALISVTAGTVRFGADLGVGSPNATLAVSNGAAVVFNASQTLGALSVTGGATASVGLSALPRPQARVLVVGALNVAANSTLDLRNNALVLRAAGLGGPATFAAVRTLVTEGYNGGDWLGVGGVTSSTAAADGTRASALGYATFASIGRSDFDGVTGLSPDDVVVGYTYYGDTNLDQLVNTDDVLNILSAGKLDTGAPATWAEGDMDFDGDADTDDILQLLATGRLDQ